MFFGTRQEVARKVREVRQDPNSRFIHPSAWKGSSPKFG